MRDIFSPSWCNWTSVSCSARQAIRPVRKSSAVLLDFKCWIERTCQITCQCWSTTGIAEKKKKGGPRRILFMSHASSSSCTLFHTSPFSCVSLSLAPVLRSPWKQGLLQSAQMQRDTAKAKSESDYGENQLTLNLLTYNEILSWSANWFDFFLTDWRNPSFLK